MPTAEWHAFFENQFGPDRWAALAKALTSPSDSEESSAALLFVPPIIDDSEVAAKAAMSDLQERGELRRSGVPFCWHLAAGHQGALPLGYFLDGASALAVGMAQITGGRVLDLCAAPGGKSLLVAARLAVRSSPADSCLVAADISLARRQRLQRNLRSRFRPNVVLVHVVPSTTQAIRGFGFFDKVLIDAPCSTDGHMARKCSESWTSKVPKANAKRQLQLLLDAAANYLRPGDHGGEIIYSTCALAEEENDRVIEKFLLHRHGANFEVIPPLELLARCNAELEGMRVLLRGAKLDGEQSDKIIPVDATTYGVHFLPDVSCGFGPLFVCALSRKNLLRRRY